MKQKNDLISYGNNVIINELKSEKMWELISDINIKTEKCYKNLFLDNNDDLNDLYSNRIKTIENDINQLKDCQDNLLEFTSLFEDKIGKQNEELKQLSKEIIVLDEKRKKTRNKIL